MTFYPTKGRDARRLYPSSNPGRRHRANFARAATISAFGHHAWALDHADFIDRQPWEMPARSPEARIR